eukprot:scpid57455/ scgid28780/ 
MLQTELLWVEARDGIDFIEVIRLQYQCLHILIASCYQSCDESGSLSMLRLSHVLRTYYDNLISRAVSEGSGTVFEGSGTVSAVGQFQKALGQCQQAVGQCQKTDNCVSTQQNSFRSQWDSVRRQQCTTLLCDHKHCRERLPECPCSPIFYSHHRYSLWCGPMLSHGS